ncbi:MAG: UbiA prenyltransferase family protein [Thermoguttaceae bacterium]
MISDSLDPRKLPVNDACSCRLPLGGGLSGRTLTAAPYAHPTWLGHLKIIRCDHWVKNVFMLPGIIAAMTVEPWAFDSRFLLALFWGTLSMCIVASSNYVINEVLDAPYDRYHPTKCRRPVPVGEVSVPWAYVQWIVMLLVGLATATLVSRPFAVTMGVLWVMGCIYNIPPLRFKDLPYLDVLCEAVNNPLRLMAGWFIVGSTVILPASLLMSYWMIGCYFMAIKRYAEYRDIANPEKAAAYRRSFAHYNADRLLVTVMFYGSSAMLFLGAFTVRYHIELILAYPLVALVMAIYLWIGLKPNSAAQAPEKLHREPALMASVVACAIVMFWLLIVNIPLVHKIFAPTLPVVAQTGHSDDAYATEIRLP